MVVNPEDRSSRIKVKIISMRRFISLKLTCFRKELKNTGSVLAECRCPQKSDMLLLNNMSSD